MGRRVARGSFYIFVSQAVALLLRVLLVFFLARLLGPSRYGRYSAVFAFCAIMEMFFRSGFTGSIVRAIASEREKAYSLVRFGIMGQFAWAACIFLVVSAGAGFWATRIFRDASFVSYLRIAPLYFIPMALFVLGCSVLNARREFERSALMQVYWIGLRVLVVMVFVLCWRRVEAAFYAMFIAALAGLIPLKRVISGIERKKADIDRKRIIILAFSLVVSAVALRTVFQVDKIFVKNILRDDTIVGIYALGSNFSLILQLFVGVLIATLYPSMSASFARADLGLTRRYLVEGTRYLTLVVLPAAFGLALVGKDVLSLVFGTQYLKSVLPFMILIFASAFFSFFLLYCHLLVSVKRQWANVLISVLILGAALALNPLFIRKYGFMGAAWATLVSSAAGAVTCGIYIFRVLKVRYPWPSLLRISGGAVVCFCLGSAVTNFSPIIRYSVYVVLAAGFMVFLCVSRELTARDWLVAKGIFRRKTAEG